ncbi:MAG: DMT family transporter [Paracoccaceae bacterium]
MTQQKTMGSIDWFEILLLAAIWGGVFLATAIVLRDLPVFTLVAARVGGGALALWAYLLIRGIPIRLGRAELIGFLGMGLLNNVIPFVLMAWGQTHIESSLAAIFNASTAFFGVIVAAALLADERLSARKTGGVLLGLGGVVIALGWESLRSFDMRSLAQLAVIAGTVSYAFAGVWARKWLGHLRPELAAAGMLSAATLIMLPLALAFDGVPKSIPAPASIVSLLFIMLVATAGAYLLYYRILARAGAGNLMLVTLLIPPFAIIFGAAVLTESLPTRSYAGLGLIAIGMLVLDGRVFHRLLHRRPAR